MNRILGTVVLLVTFLTSQGCRGSDTYLRVKGVFGSLAESNCFVEVTANPYRITTGKIRLSKRTLGKLHDALAGLGEVTYPLEKTKWKSDFKITLYASGTILESWVPVNDHWFRVSVTNVAAGEEIVVLHQRDRELHNVLKEIFSEYALKPVFTIDGEDVVLSADEIRLKEIGDDRVIDKDTGHLLEVTCDRREGVKNKYIFYPSGQLRVVKQYLNGVLHGQVAHLFEGGKLSKIMPYKNGNLHGERIFLNEAGIVTSRVAFRDGTQLFLEEGMFDDVSAANSSVTNGASKGPGSEK